jgi:hypothetical protein
MRLERNLIAAILRKLPKQLHSQSMTAGSATQNGIPDRYFDGPTSDLWVEFKQLKSMPRNGIARGAYTPLQIAWMERRFNNSAKQNVIGIVGLPDRRVCLQFTPSEWKEGTPIDRRATSIEGAAQWIAAFCGV